VNGQLESRLRGEEGLVLWLVLGSGLRVESGVEVDFVSEEEIELGRRVAGNGLNFRDLDEAG
jgi:hypothetical protein